ncbi:protein of unknown function [Variovorax sp. YR266]|uniref:DUF4352 domain-containing protein n=1 Tax=Variovorax sp. YR266 TaxID=1884386 RepID=UPI000896CE34|nr:DUF4352 domain-containing protein [Variovorax sp. YR266]SDZ70474.1 protein of unknown function [Variovorax sp. YR266]
MANPQHRLAGCLGGHRSLAALLFAATLAIAPVFSIAAEGDGKNFAWGTRVTRDNVAFEFQEARYANLVVDSSSNGDSPKQYKGDFVLLQVNITNTADQPLFVRFQPVFRLIDASGALYEPHEMLTKLVNPKQEGQTAFGDPLAAGQSMQRRVLFSVPKQLYRAVVIVPRSAERADDGVVTYSGPYFFYDLAPLRSAPSARNARAALKTL